jgi:hypothetical protein
MPSRLPRFAARRGWRAAVLLGLMPVLFAAYETAALAHGAIWIVAYGVYVVTAVVFLVLAWQLSFRRRNG